jgi:hypothetical protein
MDKFIIIGGMPRSGTNLARRIIGSHSKIAIPPSEFRFLDQAAEGRSVSEILANERLERWDVDLSDLRSQGHREAFVGSLMRYAQHAGKEIPGEKTPLNEFYYDVLEEWLGGFELKFVHLVRNPFDAMASFKHSTIRHNARRNGYPGLSTHCRNWVRSVSIGLARARYNPGGYYLVKYEDLATDPTGEAKDLCAFLGVEFEKERMLGLSDFQGHRDNTSFPEDRGEEHERYRAIHRPESRKHYLSDSERQVVGAICGELAHALGYEDDDFNSSPPEETRLGVIRRLSQAARRRLQV